MPDTEPLPHLLTIEQLAEHLGVTQRHVRRLVAEKRVPYLKVAEVRAVRPGRDRAVAQHLPSTPSGSAR